MDAELLRHMTRGPLLLVGEGDFSFSVALYNKVQMSFVSSTVETYESLIMLHSSAADNIKKLEKVGTRVLYNIDATKLHLDSTIGTFASIVFNFPHAGGKSNIKKNRELLKLFFLSAVKVLQEDGHVFVTLCKGQGGTHVDNPRRDWQNCWQVTAMAAEAGLILRKVLPFSTGYYSEYSSRGYRSQDKQFRTENAVTHVFARGASCHLNQLLREDASNICHSDVHFNHIELVCQVTSDGHPCKMLLDVLASILNAEVYRGKSLRFTEAPVSMDDVDSHLASSLGGSSRSPAQHAAILQRLERSPPDCLASATQAEAPSAGVRCVAYLLLPKGSSSHVDQLLSHCFGKSKLFLRTNHEPNLHPGSIPLFVQAASSVVRISDRIAIARGADCAAIGEVYDKGSCYVWKLDLSLMAMHVFDISDDRWLWSHDELLLTSCLLQPLGADASAVSPFVPWCISTPVYTHDLSMWINSSFSLGALCQLVHNVAGLCCSQLQLIDVFYDSVHDRYSHCYRLHFNGLNVALTYAQSYICYQRIRLLARDEMGFSVR